MAQALENSSKLRIVSANQGSLLFYNAETGVGATAIIDVGGHYTYVSTISGFSKGWTHIVGASNGSVLFYNESTGDGATATIDARGNFASVSTISGFNLGLTHIVSANQGSLLFYNAETGVGATATIDADGKYAFVNTISGFSKGWTHRTHIVGASNGSVLFYNESTGIGETVTIDARGNFAYGGKYAFVRAIPVTRRNAWNKNGTFDNPDLLWYAKGVGVIQSRPLDNPNSWWFFAAIHGQYIAASNTSFPGWGFIPGPPQVPTTPLPSQKLQDLYWDQCQHQSWYFLPWHRGYLMALEAQIRVAVVSLGGPADWALPYWNYFGPGDEYKIPPAFTQQTLPDGTPNPLFVKARYGPHCDGDIFISIPQASAACLNNTLYTGSNADTLPPGFGGPQTGFWHFEGISGNLESNPHNQVHADIGGSSECAGLMNYPETAALDPIFYLHHSNIDRMWAIWNEMGNSNPTDPNWLKGPVAGDDRTFRMIIGDGSRWAYTPADVNSISQLNYTYDNLSVAVSAQPSNKLAQRLMKLRAAPPVAEVVPGENMGTEDDVELVGANDKVLPIKSSGARTTVRLDSGVRQKVSASLAAASEASLPDQVYLQLENVRGTIDALKLNVSVNQQNAGTVALFGLRRASLEDGKHGGKGLTFVLDITDIIDNLHLDNALDADALDVRIDPSHAIPNSVQLTVGRVSVYRQGQQ